ncbi:MAG: DUF6693 family protein [Gammaproteobacteria bacterium]
MVIEGNVSTIDILGHLIVWLIILVLTLGLGIFFYPYSFAKFILNRSVLVDADRTLQLRCELDIFSQLGHIIIWALISIVTFGIGYFFYLYKVWNFALSKTSVVPDTVQSV